MQSTDSWMNKLPQYDPEMSKKSFVTNITPLPPNISRETAIAQLHDHSGMIKLNPLVLRHQATLPPPNASEDEFHECKWYEITDEINYLPGGVAKSEVSYKGGFYDQPYGLQTHVFAPAGVDIRAKWSVRGNMPGEPRDIPELGVDAPKEGLYLREDIELRCNVFLSNFVKRNLKKSHGKLVEDLLVRVHNEEEDKLRRTQSNSTTPAASISAPSGASSLRLDRNMSGLASVSSQTSHTSTPQYNQEQHQQQCICGAAMGGTSHPRDCPQYSFSPYQSLDPRKQMPSSPLSNHYQPHGNHLLNSREQPAELDAVAQGGQNYSPADNNPFWIGESVPWPRTSQIVSDTSQLPSQQKRQRDFVAYGPQPRIPKGNQHGPWKPQADIQDFGEHAELPSSANTHEMGGNEVEYWKLAAGPPET